MRSERPIDDLSERFEHLPPLDQTDYGEVERRARTVAQAVAVRADETAGIRYALTASDRAASVRSETGTGAEERHEQWRKRKQTS